MENLLMDLFKRSCEAGHDGNNLGDFVTPEERKRLRGKYPLDDSDRKVSKVATPADAS